MFDNSKCFGRIFSKGVKCVNIYLEGKYGKYYEYKHIFADKLEEYIKNLPDEIVFCTVGSYHVDVDDVEYSRNADINIYYLPKSLNQSELCYSLGEAHGIATRKNNNKKKRVIIFFEDIGMIDAIPDNLIKSIESVENIIFAKDMDDILEIIFKGDPTKRV